MGNAKELSELAKEIISYFKIERIVYCTISVIAALIAFVLIILLILNDFKNWSYCMAALGSSGVISICCARILKMWDQVIALIDKHYKG